MNDRWRLLAVSEAPCVSLACVVGLRWESIMKPPKCDRRNPGATELLSHPIGRVFVAGCRPIGCIGQLRAIRLLVSTIRFVLSNMAVLPQEPTGDAN